MSYYFKVLKSYSKFRGRARRSEYWYFFLFNAIVAAVLSIIASSTDLPILSTIYSLAILIPGIAVSVRRMHDVNKSGWYIIIPIYNLILACTNGTEGENSFGPDPKQLN